MDETIRIKKITPLFLLEEVFFKGRLQ